MPEPIDMIVPMLQRLQLDVSDMNSRLGRVEERLGGLEERFEAVGSYITFTMGLHSQNRVDVERHSVEISEIKRRLDVLEAQS